MDVKQRSLPPLPMHRGYLLLHNTGGISQVSGFTEKQMTEYAMAAIAALTPPEGYVLVPVEPTEAMITAFWGKIEHGDHERAAAEDAWRDALAARPEVKP